MEDYNGLCKAHLTNELLHKLSKTHGFIFGAIAELADSARDGGATELHIYATRKMHIRGGYALCFYDNGCGMSTDELSSKVLYGKPLMQRKKASYCGFMAGSLRIGNDVIILTKKKHNFSCLLLSKTFNEDNQISGIVVPLVSFNESLEPNVNSATEQKQHDCAMSLILKYSPFKSKEGLFNQFNNIKGTSGTSVFVYNLKLLDNGQPVLDIFTDRRDILISHPDPYDHTSSSQNTRLLPEHHSLRTYLSILYTHPRMKIYLRGRKVSWRQLMVKLYNPLQYVLSGDSHGSLQTKPPSKDLCKDDDEKTMPMKRPRLYKKRLSTSNAGFPQVVKQRECSKFAVQKIMVTLSPIDVTFGVNVDNPSRDGLFIYSCSRLIEMGVQVRPSQKNNWFRGIVGVVNVPYTLLEPTHDKQGFNNLSKYNALLGAIVDRLSQYCSDIGLTSEEAVAKFWKKYNPRTGNMPKPFIKKELLSTAIMSNHSTESVHTGEAEIQNQKAQDRPLTHRKNGERKTVRRNTLCKSRKRSHAMIKENPFTSLRSGKLLGTPVRNVIKRNGVKRLSVCSDDTLPMVDHQSEQDQTLDDCPTVERRQISNCTSQTSELVDNSICSNCDLTDESISADVAVKVFDIGLLLQRPVPVMNSQRQYGSDGPLPYIVRCRSDDSQSFRLVECGDSLDEMKEDSSDLGFSTVLIGRGDSTQTQASPSNEVVTSTTDGDEFCQADDNSLYKRQAPSTVTTTSPLKLPTEGIVKKRSGGLNPLNSSPSSQNPMQSQRQPQENPPLLEHYRHSPSENCRLADIPPLLSRMNSEEFTIPCSTVEIKEECDDDMLGNATDMLDRGQSCMTSSSSELGSSCPAEIKEESMELVEDLESEDLTADQFLNETVIVKRDDRWTVGKIVWSNHDRVKIKLTDSPEDCNDIWLPMDSHRWQLSIPSQTDQEKITENLRVCLQYFLPEDFPFSGTSIQGLSTNDLADFPIKMLMVKHEESLESILNSVTNPVQQQLSELRTNVARLLTETKQDIEITNTDNVDLLLKTVVDGL